MKSQKPHLLHAKLEDGYLYAGTLNCPYDPNDVDRPCAAAPYEPGCNAKEWADNMDLSDYLDGQWDDPHFPLEVFPAWFGDDEFHLMKHQIVGKEAK